jgi:hypothetical protein
MADPEPGGVSPIRRTSASRARQIVVSGGAEATVRVWDLESAEPLHQLLRGHDGDVNTLALGELRGRAVVASGGDDRTVRLWGLASGESLGAALLGHRRKVRAVAIGELGGRPLVVSGSDDNTVRVWDLDSRRLLYEPLTGHHGNVTAIAVGELRGRAIAVSGSEDFTLRVWDLEAGRPLRVLRGHKGFVHAVALGELGEQPIAVSGGDDKTVRVWDLENARPMGEPLVGHKGWVNAVAVGTIGDQPVAVSGGDDNTVRTWDLSAGGPLGRPLRHDRGVNAVAMGELQGAPPPASGQTHRDTDEPAAWRVATDRRQDTETAPEPGAAGPCPSPEPVTAGAPASSMPSPGPGPSMRPGVQPPSREARREPWWPTALFGLLFSVMLLGGLVLVVFAGRDLADLVNPPSSSRHANGVVIRVDTVTCGSGSNKHTCHNPVVRFVTARKEVIEFTSGLDVGYGTGDSVEVRYDPGNPHHARLDSLRARVGSGVLDVAGVLGGLALTLVGGLLLWGVVRGEPPASPAGIRRR